VADFRISHLSLGETDLETTGLESAPGVVLVKTVVDGGFSEEGSVTLLFGTGASGGINAPSISNQ